MKKYSSAAVWIVCSVMLVLAAVTMWQTGKGSNDMTYSAFVQKWNANEIESVVIKEDKMTIEGRLQIINHLLLIFQVKLLIL